MTAALLRHRSPEPTNAEGKMSFLDHLDDLRKRIIYSMCALGVGMLVAFAFMSRLLDFVLGPTRRILPPGSDLIFTRPNEGFAVYLDVALMAGLILAAPAIMYQVWLFVAPALYANEKKFVIPFVLLTAIGSVAGALFSHGVLFPAMMSFFATFSAPGLRFMPRLEDVFDLYVRMLIAMVVVFQIPTLAFFLAKLRLVTGRLLWGGIKYAILVIFIVAALLTPSSDPWNQAVFAAPMIALYLIGIVVAWLAEPKREKPNPAGLRLVFAAAVLDHAWRHHTAARQ